MRDLADGGTRTAFSGGLASAHGLSDDDRERRDAAQRKLKKALADGAGCAKVLADPKKLPTIKAGDRWICQWEQLGLACPLETGHFERNSHKVCSYCLVIGHVLVRCPMASKDGVDVSTLLAGPQVAPAATPERGAGKGKGKGRGTPTNPPAAALSRWEQMEKERAAREATCMTANAAAMARGGGRGTRGQR